MRVQSVILNVFDVSEEILARVQINFDEKDACKARGWEVVTGARDNKGRHLKCEQSAWQVTHLLYSAYHRARKYWSLYAKKPPSENGRISRLQQRPFVVHIGII